MLPPSRGDEVLRVATPAASGLEWLVLDALTAPGAVRMDGLWLTCAPLVPEVRLLLADDAIVLWARLEAEAGRDLPAPYWASAWAGGQALARYVLDHPETVAGRRVLDLASGSGLVAIAAAIAGAATVTANDIDPYAISAITANALVNGVDLRWSSTDLLDGDSDGGDGGGAVDHDRDAVDVVLAGDVLYHPAVATRMLPFLARFATWGGRVLVGDPDRGHLPDWLAPIATYRVPMVSAPEDAQISVTSVLASPPGIHPHPTPHPTPRPT